MVPDGIGVNDGDGTLNADAEAIGLAAVNEGLRAAKFQLFESVFEELPGLHAFARIAAFGFGRGGTEKDVTLVGIQPQGFGGRCQLVRHWRGANLGLDRS